LKWVKICLIAYSFKKNDFFSVGNFATTSQSWLCSWWLIPKMAEADGAPYSCLLH
jgi:hypothetical protein